MNRGIYEYEGIEIAHYDSPTGFLKSLLDRLSHQLGWQRRFPRGVESLNDFDVAEELVWRLVPSGYVFGG